ncbi:NAD-dependent epimerase/dehydratase family protein [Sphingomonas montanisoli]|uniref:NAD(P)H-binding protein n=1 Tax=Sphingomonas montanisoli TaxID=2606412 RepID=A0A5D9C1X6_9SPHN|nr:NAD-dependent epimerase/dehydratase family protein [Sphingomonas montanisoli]TZG25734.1 NAD(P)H-binding protein [Sphingomonas montanisoli]
MRALVVRATGYIGSAVARRFKAAGAAVAGIARSAHNAEVLEGEGVIPVAGDLDHPATIAAAARDFDITVLAGIGSGTDERAVVSAVIESCRRSARRFIYTSGTGVLGIESRDGQWSDYTFAEDDPFPFPGGATRAWRLPTEDMVRTAGLEGVAGMVIRPPLIYGRGGSTQVPAIFKSVRTTGSACYVGAGLNLYSNVHVDDLADLYWLVATNGASGALYHAVSGEADFRSIAEAVASVLQCPTRSVTFEEGCGIWGEQIAGVALAVNSRSIARRSQQELGWKPRHRDIIHDIRAGSYFEKHTPAG